MNYQESDPGLKKLQSLLAEKRTEVPNTDVESFLIELHRRQRAQLLRRQADSGFLEQGITFIRGLFTPAYGTAFACAAVAVCFLGIHSTAGLSSSVRVASAPAASAPTVAISTSALESAMALQHPTSTSTPSSLTKFFSGTRFAKLAASAQSAELFIPKTLHDSPRFLLANSQVAYDARASF